MTVSVVPWEWDTALDWRIDSTDYFRQGQSVNPGRIQKRMYIAHLVVESPKPLCPINIEVPACTTFLPPLRAILALKAEL